MYHSKMFQDDEFSTVFIANQFNSFLSLGIAGIYGFKCDEAERLFLSLKLAIENCPKVTGNGYILDQITNHQDNQSAYITNNNNNLTSSNNQSNVIVINNGQLNHQLSHQLSPNSTFNQLNSQLNQPSHLYANDLREYINITALDNGLVFKEDASPLVKENAEKAKMNFNYVQLSDLQLNLANTINLNNNNNESPAKNGQLIEDSNEQHNVHESTTKSKELKKEEEVNYTTLDLELLEKQNNNLETNSDDCTTVSTAPTSPVDKFERHSEFRSATNSAPISPTLPNETFTQQYSLIDFDKTKALTGIRNDKERND